MKTYIGCFVFLWFSSIFVYAQGPFAPPVGQIGTKAMSADSSVFYSWATGALVNRGPMNVANVAAGLATVGDANSPLGMPGENGILSLGDGGSVVLTFNESFSNLPGPDFAVFENSFSDDFLELAFVEVSSDGIHFVRFPSISYIDTNVQVGGFGLTDATEINNLAGKYRGGYGTPFDLEELKDSAGLDISQITHIKIVDVIGSMDPNYLKRDSEGRPINDPWPTEFPSSGFDLDAIGLVSLTTSLDEKNSFSSIQVYPNPARDRVTLNWESEEIDEITILGADGRTIENHVVPHNQSKWVIDLAEYRLGTGLYYLRFRSKTSITNQVLLIGPH